MAKKVSLPVVEYDDAVVNPDAQQNTVKTIVCNGCELEKKPRVAGMGAGGDVDIMLVSESPSTWSTSNQQVFYGRGGRIIRQTWKMFVDADVKDGGKLKFKHLRKWDTYAVQCQVEQGRDQTGTISKKTIDRCSHYLKSAVKNKRPKVILAFGSNALKALGYKGEKFMEVRGRLLEVDIAGHRCQVLPTFSTKHLIGKTGLYNLFHNDFLRAMRVASGVDAAKAQISIEEITAGYPFPKTVDEVRQVCDEIINHVVGTTAQAGVISVDTETNTVNPHRADAKVLCISFAWDTGKATAIPLWHPDTYWTESEMLEVLGHIRRVLECPKPKIFHNAKFDLKFIEMRHGLTVNNYAWDTMLGEHLLREDQHGAYSLKVLGRSYFPEFANYADKVHDLAKSLTVEESAVADTIAGVRKGKIKAGTPCFDDDMVVEMSKKELHEYLYGKARHQKKKVTDSGYERVPIDTLLTYAAIDTDLTRRLIKHQFGRLREETFSEQGRSLMKGLCVPATRALGKMEFKGMRVDTPYLDFLEQELSKIVAQKREELDGFWDPYELNKGIQFNPNSPQHIGHVLYMHGVNGATRYGPWAERHAKSQQWKTDKKTLRAIVEKTDCPFTKSLLAYRAAYKALSGFVDEIRMLSSYDGYLHTSFHLNGTSTGRLSSSNINMQNLPPNIAGFNIKRVFLPDDPETELIVNVDYKGAELRIFTAYAKDQKLIDALNGGMDVHSLFVQEVYGIPYEEVANRDALKDTDKKRYLYLKALRDNCKRVVFGILYGAMARKIAETAGITEEEAQKVIDTMFTKFPSMKGYMDATVGEIHRRGFVETLLGRRRRFPLQSVNGFFRGQAERRGKNMKIQSTSSDIVLDRLCELDEHIGELGGRLLITVHDSIVATCKKKYIEQLPDFLHYYCEKRVAEKYPWLPVVFSCDIEVGPNYGETVSIDKYIQKERARPKTAEELMFAEFDQEALAELQEDEDEQREREAQAKEGAGRTSEVA